MGIFKGLHEPEWVGPDREILNKLSIEGHQLYELWCAARDLETAELTLIKIDQFAEAHKQWWDKNWRRPYELKIFQQVSSWCEVMQIIRLEVSADYLSAMTQSMARDGISSVEQERYCVEFIARMTEIATRDGKVAPNIPVATIIKQWNPFRSAIREHGFFTTGILA